VTLSTTQRGFFEKARRLGAGASQIQLDDSDCLKLANVIARDLGVSDDRICPPSGLPKFFDPAFATWRAAGPAASEVFEALVQNIVDSELYFHCLASIYLRRLKYARILATQPMPTLEQVGPRGLLQFGYAPPAELVALLFWRKWIYDIDNRAAQETGYIFEPIIAASIGGVSYSGTKSPVQSRKSGGGRQVDCIRERSAYELKLRVTIAASGQGRWGAELDFPEDCKASGFRPVLIVFDSTENPKLIELKKAFEDAGGAHYIGEHAWQHLEEVAGETMGIFLDRYVRGPLEDLLQAAPAPRALPDLILRQGDRYIAVRIGEFEMRIDRTGDDENLVVDDRLPPDVDEELPGP
jgi:hypothetical protein